jgi:hypothetical protein
MRLLFRTGAMQIYFVKYKSFRTFNTHPMHLTPYMWSCTAHTLIVMIVIRALLWTSTRFFIFIIYHFIRAIYTFEILRIPKRRIHTRNTETFRIFIEPIRTGALVEILIEYFYVRAHFTCLRGIIEVLLGTWARDALSFCINIWRLLWTDTAKYFLIEDIGIWTTDKFC